MSIKPSTLRPGDVVRTPGGHLVEFVRREPRASGRPAVNVFRGQRFVGLNGPDDDGHCVAFDHDLRRYERVSSTEGATARRA